MPDDPKLDKMCSDSEDPKARRRYNIAPIFIRDENEHVEK